MPLLEISAIVLLVAFALDAIFGEPPNAAHPVAWLGRLIARLVGLAPEHGKVAQLLFGAALAGGVPLGAALLAGSVLWLLEGVPVAQVVVGALLLKATFALRALGEAGAAMADALERGGPEAARPLLGALCSREPAALDARQLSAATVESLSENLSDSLVGPLFYYALFGLPGAVLFRAVNTLDSMVGYRGRYEHLGKASARLDDLLCFVPARLTAASLLLGGALLRLPVRDGMHALWRDGSVTESPNAGRPMATAAGLLGVELDKPGAYRLNAGAGAASAETIRRALSLVRLAGFLAAVAAFAALQGLHG